MFEGDKELLVKSLRDALYGTMIVSYAQGLAMLRTASIEYNYKLNLREIANIWKGGCIIRSKLLFPIMEAYKRDPNLINLIFDPEFSSILKDWGMQTNWRYVIKSAVDIGIPVPALQASLTYVDSYRSAFLPANVIQLQRDTFGAHGFKRIDKEGDFHIPR
jgi:6-phosphogluconate dehydrogenase